MKNAVKILYDKSKSMVSICMLTLLVACGKPSEIATAECILRQDTINRHQMTTEVASELLSIINRSEIKKPIDYPNNALPSPVSGKYIFSIKAGENSYFIHFNHKLECINLNLSSKDSDYCEKILLKILK